MKRIISLIVACAAFNFVFGQCTPNSNSLNFNGTSAYVNITNQNLDITDSITVEAWIYSTQWGATVAQNSIFCKHGWSSTQGGYVLRAGGNGQLSFNFQGVDPGGLNVGWIDDSTYGAPALTLNAWHHVAGTFDGTELKVYVDGILAQTKAFTGTIGTSTAYSPRIGALSDPVNGPGRYWKGNIDEVRVWHRALSQSEIAANMNNHVDTATAVGLAGYWRMNEGTGTTINDISGNGNTGSLVSTVWATIVPFNTIPPIPIITWLGTDLTVNTTLAIQWYFNFNPIAGATSNIYTPTQNGTYTVVVTNTAGCTRTSPPFNLTSAGIYENQNTTGATVYPNPANGNDNITFTIPEADKNLSLTITDLSGKTIACVTTDGIKTDKIILTDSNLKKGVYFYKLSGDKANRIGKLVVE